MATTESSKGRSGEAMFMEELHQAAVCMRECIRCIDEAGERKIVKSGHPDSDYDDNPLQFRSEMVVLSDKLFQLANDDNGKMSAGWIGNKGESFLGWSSKARRSAASIDLEKLLHRVGILTQMTIAGNPESEELLDLAAKKTPQGIVGQADIRFPWETIPELIREILLKFTKVAGGDIALVFQAEKIRKEAMAVLRFGFRLQLFSEQIDELRHEMCKILTSFSPKNQDIRSTLLKFIIEPYLSRICKLQWISERISMLQQMDPNFDSKVKSTIIQLKSESFLSAMEEDSGREGVAGEDQEVSMQMEGKRFASYRRCWKRIWGNKTRKIAPQHQDTEGSQGSEASAGRVTARAVYFIFCCNLFTCNAMILMLKCYSLRSIISVAHFVLN